MRRPWSLTLAVLAIVPLAACASRPAAEDWLDVGFRSPRQTFRTFQTALAADSPTLEYRCLSGALKSREGLSETVWREFREELFGAIPGLRRAASAEILTIAALDPWHVRIEAEATYLFWTRRFALLFRREDFYELWSGDRLYHDDVAPFSEMVMRLPSQALLQGFAPLPEGGDVDAVTEIRIGMEWKIDGFELLEDEDAAAEQP